MVIEYINYRIRAVVRLINSKLQQKRKQLITHEYSNSIFYFQTIIYPVQRM